MADKRRILTQKGTGRQNRDPLELSLIPCFNTGRTTPTEKVPVSKRPSDFFLNTARH